MPVPHQIDSLPVTSGDQAAVAVSIRDSLYGSIKVSGWAAAFLATPAFERLAGVSLSSVPGELLFRHPFPSRLDHAVGVYHLARIARPRDRALQLAALAHDLGHGPFSHLCEPLMIERLHEDHESRSISLLAQVRESLPRRVQERLAPWLDWGEVAALMRGEGRGVLLNGGLDYDNIDNVARFKLHADFGRPQYDPETLAHGLRLIPSSDEHGKALEIPSPVALQETAEAEGRAWQRDRVRVYQFLHGDDGGHRNLAVHAMLRKAVDLASNTNILPAGFFDLTDSQALAVLRQGLDRGLLALVQRITQGQDRWHQCVWEAETAADEPVIPVLLSQSGKRLSLEAELAAEAGLPPHEVILDALVSNAARALPELWPLSRNRSDDGESPHREPPESEFVAPRVLHLFMGAGYGSDYAHRLRLAVLRRLGRAGITPRTPRSGVELTGGSGVAAGHSR
jgi:HD superfamily phosphohydrolase